MIHSGFKSQCVPSYRILTEAQIKEIHGATLEILENVGVKVMLPEAIDMLAGAGCRVKADGVVRMPGWLVEAAIRSAPSGFTVYNRLGEPAMRLEGRKVHFGMGTDLTRTYDLESGELRESRLGDVVNAAVIGDALTEIDFIASYALPYDSPVNLMYIDSFKAQLENAVKPIFFTAAGREDLKVIHEMASAVMGGPEALRETPMLVHYAEPLSPLVHSAGALEKLFYCAEHGIPVTYAPGMMSGASAPVTLAGAVAMGNAEALSGLVMHQLRAKGAPIVSGFGMSTLDMKTSACIYACPEYRLALSACADLYHYYGVPVWGTAGVSDAHCLDPQAGMEWAISLLAAALDGANLVHDVGYLGQGLVGHPAALVMCAEIIGYAKRFTGGFGMTKAHLALDVIKAVGPKGAFLTTRHTLAHFREEHWQPGLCNRALLGQWVEKGGKTWADVAVEKTKAILSEHRPSPLTDDVSRTLDALRREASAALEGVRFES